MVSNLVQLITIPHILSTVGFEHFGIITISMALTQYLITFTDYGFNLTATKEISINRHSQRRVNRIVSAVMASKLLLMVVGFVVLMGVVLAIPSWREDWFVFFSAYTIVVGTVLYPLWYFQGVELLRLVTIFNIITRLLYGVLIFTFIQVETDYNYVHLYNGLCQVFTGSLSLYIAIKYFKLRFTLPSWRWIRWAYKASWHTFVSYFLNNIYVNSYAIILDIFAPRAIVGQFGMVEKMISGIRQIHFMAFQVSFPHASRLALEGKLRVQSFLNKVMAALSIMYVFVAIAVFLFAEQLVYLFSKASEPLAIQMLQVGVVVPIILAFSIKAYQNMLIYNFRNIYSSIFVYATSLSLVTTFVLTASFGSMGTMSSMIITELLVTISLVYFGQKKLRGVPA